MLAEIIAEITQLRADCSLHELLYQYQLHWWKPLWQKTTSANLLWNYYKWKESKAGIEKARTLNSKTALNVVSSQPIQHHNDDASNHPATVYHSTNIVPGFCFVIKFLLPSWPHPCNAWKTRFGKNYFVDWNTLSIRLINAPAISDFEWWFLRLLRWIGWDCNCSMLSSVDKASIYLP